MMTQTFRELLSGGVVAATGVAFSIGALQYGLGSFSQIEPGMFPFIVGLMVACTGLLIVATALLARAAPSPADQGKDLNDSARKEWRALLLVSAALIIFGLVINQFGMAPAVIVLVLLVGIAERERRPLQALLVAIGLAALTTVLFIYGLGMNIPIATWGR